MPTRSLRSPVLRWPDATCVVAAARAWAATQAARRPETDRIGYFGSYARGNWGVGSDLDILVVVDAALEPFERRGLMFETRSLPVPADVVVYTLGEWGRLCQRVGFGRTVAAEVVWVYER